MSKLSMKEFEALPVGSVVAVRMSPEDTYQITRCLVLYHPTI